MARERASQHDRDRTAQKLRSGWLQGAVSTDTFEVRLGLALAAKEQHQLRTLVHDLPRRNHPLKRLLSNVLRRRTVVGSDALVLSIPEDAAEVVLGRHRSCERVYDDDSVSRRHAVVLRRGKNLRLFDLESTNGTWLNGVRVTDAVSVSDGDEVQLGRVHLIVRTSAV